jgi:hypothetical protein
MNFRYLKKFQNGGMADLTPNVVLQVGAGRCGCVCGEPAAVAGKCGVRRVALRHGVSCLASGTRHTVGLIFHDAD